MSKDRIDSTNLHITDAQVEKGKIKKLEVNGKKIKIGNSDRVEPNKVTTIDVSEYTGPVETEPDFGFDAMAKNTIMLENVPTEIHSFTLYAYANDNITGMASHCAYFINNPPNVGDIPLYAGGSRPMRLIVKSTSPVRAVWNDSEGKTWISLSTNPNPDDSDLFQYYEANNITINF